MVNAARKAADITSQLLALGRRQIRRLEDLDLSTHAARTADQFANSSRRAAAASVQSAAAFARSTAVAALKASIALAIGTDNNCGDDPLFCCSPE